MQNLNQKKVFCWKQKKLTCFVSEKKYFLDGQSGSPLMFEVLYHSQKFWACLLLKRSLLVCGSLPKNNFFPLHVPLFSSFIWQPTFFFLYGISCFFFFLMHMDIESACMWLTLETSPRCSRVLFGKSSSMLTFLS